MEITTKGTKMKQLTTSQATDTDEWLNERRGRITGTKAAGVAIENYQQIDVAHLLDMADKQETAATKARTSDKAAEYLAKADDYRAKAKDAETANKRLKLTADFWGFLAELLAAEPSAENPAERGHLLENENASITINKLGIPMSDVEFDTGLWVSTDTDPRIAVSPDVHEKASAPHGRSNARASAPPTTWQQSCPSSSTTCTQATPSSTRSSRRSRRNCSATIMYAPLISSPTSTMLKHSSILSSTLI